MIQFDDVSLSFAGKPLFSGASFTLQKGERCALVGRNGSGKSTIFRIIAKEMEPDFGAVSIPRGYRIGYLQQHIQFTKPTLLEEAALGLPPGEEEMLYKAEKILLGLGFTVDDFDRAPTNFSGGYALRLHLAKVLISEPDCLLLDEPTNYLDILSIRWLAQFLTRWNGEFILISHDRDFLDQVCTHTMGLHRNEIRKFKGSTIHYFEKIVIEEELHEKTRLKVEKKRAHAEQFVERFGAKATKAAQAQSRLKMLEREPALEKLNALSNLDFSFNAAPFLGEKMLEAQNLFFSYTEEPLIENVSFLMGRKERIGIIGKNGRGKSTLLRLIHSELKPKSGHLFTSENCKIGYFGQTHIERLKPNHTIEEEISLANPLLSFTQTKAISGLMMFSGDDSLKTMSQLSGGEKSRVLLGKILAKPCNLLLLDEPTHHLDIESIEALIDALEDFPGSVIIVTHSELILRRLNLTQIILCKSNAQTTFLGNYDEFLEKIGWEEEEKKPAPVKKAPPPKKSNNLEREIKKLEEQIKTIEEQLSKNVVLLNQNPRSLELSKQIEQLQKTIDQLYQELEVLFSKI
ncbi:MAG TPA: ABC-F family ATP-binding cassette domain-containing protein [Chlamydiales bacterium]|nr:ABC-F family ATP-binding cassette domain-containing protein [Chlamydiales bacterium]